VTDTQLTTLSTFAWLVLAVWLFILLARRSTGSSWGISTAIARGLIGWTGRNGIIAGEWSGDGELPPMALPHADGPIPSKEPVVEADPCAEIEDLGSRRLT
jgi:hypothetical protein